MRFLAHRFAKPVLLVIAGIILIGSAQAITTLTIPQTVIPVPSAITTSSCSGILVLRDAPTAGSGILRYDCGGSNHNSAFTVTRAGTDVPSFNAPASVITGVGYVSNSAGTCQGFTPLTSGSSVTLQATGAYDICASYSCPNGCTVTSWTFTWSN